MTELAILEEGRLCVALKEIAPESRPIPEDRGGGVMSRGEPGTWTNVALGMGLRGPVDPGVLDEVIAWHEGVGAEPRVVVAPVAHASLLESLGERGFRLRVFEHVLFHELKTGFDADGVEQGTSIERLDRGDVEEVRRCARIYTNAFMHPKAPSGADVELTRAVMMHPRTTILVARRAGEPIGFAALELFGEIAALIGAAVLPEHRGHGLQRRLIAERLRMARGAGCRVVTVTSRPGVATEPNARRMGFGLGYTRVVMGRPGPGLVGETG